MPIARIRPNSVGRFRLNPNSFIAKNVPDERHGIAAIGISVERSCRGRRARRG
jgi:hypothetical protein